MTAEDFETLALTLVPTERVHVETRVDSAVVGVDPETGEDVVAYTAHARVERIGFEALTKAEAGYPLEDDASLRAMIAELALVLAQLDSMAERDLSVMAKRFGK